MKCRILQHFVCQNTCLSVPRIKGFINKFRGIRLNISYELSGRPFQIHMKYSARPCSAVGNVSGYRCVSDCRSRGREFDLGPVPYFRGD